MHRLNYSRGHWFFSKKNVFPAIFGVFYWCSFYWLCSQVDTGSISTVIVHPLVFTKRRRWRHSCWRRWTASHQPWRIVPRRWWPSASSPPPPVFLMHEYALCGDTEIHRIQEYKSFHKSVLCWAPANDWVSVGVDYCELNWITAILNSLSPKVKGVMCVKS